MRPSSRQRVAAWLLALPLGTGGEECARRGRLEMISFWLLCWKLLRATAGLRRTTAELTDDDSSGNNNPVNNSPTTDPVTMEISSSPPLTDAERENSVLCCRSRDTEELHYPGVHGVQQPIRDEQEEEPVAEGENGKKHEDECDYLVFEIGEPKGGEEGEPLISASDASEQPAAAMLQDAWGHDLCNRDDLSDCLQAELAIVYSDSDAGEDQWASFAACDVNGQEEAGGGSHDSVPVDFHVHQETLSENVSTEHVDFLLARQQWRKMEEEVKGQPIPKPGLRAQGSFQGTHTSLYPPTRSPRLKHREIHPPAAREPTLSSTLSPTSEDSGLDDSLYRSPLEETETAVEREIRLTLEREERHRRERGMISQGLTIPRPSTLQTGRSPPRPPACRTPTLSISPSPSCSSSLPRSLYHEMTANNVIILEPDCSSSSSRNRLLSSAIGGLSDWPTSLDTVPSANVIVVETSNLIIRSASEFCLSSAPASMETQESTFSSNPFFKLRSLSSQSLVEQEIRMVRQREEEPSTLQTGRSPPRPPACRTPTLSISPSPSCSSSLPRSLYHEMTANNVIILEPDCSSSSSRNRLLSSAIGGLSDWPTSLDTVPSANVIVVETSNLIIRSASEFCLSSAPASMETQESTFSSNPFFKLRSLSSQSLVEQEIRMVRQREEEWRRQRDEMWRKRREEEWRRGRERYDTVLVSPGLNDNISYNVPEVPDRCVSSPSSPSRTRKMERSSLSCDHKATRKFPSSN
ncbi:uncharacterized protein LOC123972540 [Micropterus dolomieu]|uniref:uncharacterized protein LOC123972540 n=1 Tax=Micropterus dolomieu TaxID=147949 RepID=UPI001E8ED83B|nr:uncharacterized protein LOC123972540 [Micropterus dolomieu]